MKKLALTLISAWAVLVLPPAANAQRESGGWWGQRTGQQPGPGGPDRSGWMDRMVERLAEELELDEGQREQFDQIVGERRERMREMGQVFRQLREAQRDGDEERVAQLRAQLPQRPEGGRNPMMGLMGGFLDDVAPILREDQLERLEEMRQRRTPEGRAERLAEELDLDEGQREQLTEMAQGVGERFRTMGEQWRQLRPLMEQRRQAEEEGDSALVEELSQRIAEQRPNPRGIMNEFFDDVDGILRDDQRERLNAIRRRMGGPQGRIEQLAQELELDEQQRPQFDEMARGLGERFRGMGEQWREQRQLLQQQREAQESGDVQRAEELSQQIQKLRPNPGAIMDEFYNQVEGILREDQVELLNAVRQRRAQQQSQRERNFGQPGGGGDRPGDGERGFDRPGQARDLGGALNLDAEQRMAFESVIQQAQQRINRGGVNEEEVAQQMAKNLRSILREDQLEAFGQIPKEVFVGGLRAGEPSDVRLVFRAARQMKLNEQQTQRLSELQKAAQQAFKELAETIRKEREKALQTLKEQASGSKEALEEAVREYRQTSEDLYRAPKMRKLGGRIKAQIVDMLSKQQAQEFNRRLKRLEWEYRLRIVREDRSRG